MGLPNEVIKLSLLRWSAALGVEKNNLSEELRVGNCAT